MKDLKQLLKKKTVGARSALDEKSISMVFEQIIREEYGKQGVKSITLISARDRKIAIKTLNSNWTNELLRSKAHILERINNQLGGAEIVDFSIVR
jgi:hypothetical protein